MNHIEITRRFGEWLKAEFLEWEYASGARKNRKDFSDYLGVQYSTLVNWMNGIRVPNARAIALLAEKLGPEIYQVLEIAPPITDSELRYVVDEWGALGAEERHSVKEHVEKYVTRRGKAEKKTGRRLGNKQE